MTFKKINKRAQAILEYFILTTVVFMVVLFFSQSPYFADIKDSCETAFNNGVTQILR